MFFSGLQKLTLLDYPQKVACTLFLGGCNLRCPFCHNASLVQHPEPQYTQEEVLSFLQKRVGMLDGVCVTGGEPLLQPNLADFLSHVKELGYLIKLDTNGCYPLQLQSLLQSKLVDYVAMDIKNSVTSYGKTVGIANFDVTPVLESVQLLQSGQIDYEFRTTVVAQLHTAQDFEEIGQWLSGTPRYFLQNFVDSGDLLCPNLSGYSPEKMEEFATICRKTIPSVQLRGL